TRAGPGHAGWSGAHAAHDLQALGNLRGPQGTGARGEGSWGVNTDTTVGDPFAPVEHVAGASQSDPILVVENISRAFGGLKAVDVERLEVQRGAITALIGPNGAGKTTFFNHISGFDKPDSGTWSF